MYKLTLRIDDQLRTYLQDIFHATHMDRNEVLQLALFYGSNSKEFKQFVRKYLNDSPPLSLEEGLGTWILAKKTQERIEGEECRHDTSLFRGNTRGKVDQGNTILPRKNVRSEWETSRPSGEVYNRGTGNGDRRLPHTSRKDGTIKITF